MAGPVRRPPPPGAGTEPEGAGAASAGEGSIPAWFADKLDFNPSPPRFRATGVRILGARLSHLREWPAAYVRYELPSGNAGLFIVDDPEQLRSFQQERAIYEITELIESEMASQGVSRAALAKRLGKSKES